MLFHELNIVSTIIPSDVWYDEGMSKPRVQYTISRIILAAAYLSCVLQWLWVLVLGLPPLIDSGALDMLTTPPPPTPEFTTPESSDPSPMAWVAVVIVTVIMLAVTVFVLIRLPRSIARTGERMLETTTEAVLPVITHHKQLPAKKRVVLSRRIMLSIRLLLTLLPFIISLFLPTPGELTHQIVTTVALWLAIISTVGFIVAWLVEPPATSRTRSRASRG